MVVVVLDNGPVVGRADRPARGAVGRRRQRHRHRPVPRGLDVDIPQVVASVLASGAYDVAARHVERLVAQHQVAHRRVLAELHVEHEHRAVVRVRHRCERRRQLRPGGDRFRRHAGQGFLRAAVVGERHPHLDRPALVGVGERVRGLRRVRDVRIGGAVVGDPLVRVGRVVQPVRVGDGRRVRGQRPAHPRRSGNRRRTRRRRVRPGGDRFRRRAEQGLLVALVVGERHPHLDGPTLLGVGQLVARAGRVGMSASAVPSFDTHW